MALQKSAMDIYLYFQQMGYLLAPFGISYRTHGAQFNTNTDPDYLRNYPLVLFKVKGMANNVVEMLKLDIEPKLKGKLVPVAESIRTSIFFFKWPYWFSFLTVSGTYRTGN